MTYMIDALPGRIYLGKHTENNAHEVRVDCSAWLAKRPELKISAWVTQPGRAAAYPAATRMEGNVLVWPITAGDTAVVGTGKVEFMGTTVAGCRQLSATAWTQVKGSTTCNTCETPEAAKPWVAEVLAAADKAEAAATRPPVILDGGTWAVWDAIAAEYKDTGIPARGDKGEKGDTGATGPAGYTPQKGVDYFDGEKGDTGATGPAGKDGKPGKGIKTVAWTNDGRLRITLDDNSTTVGPVLYGTDGVGIADIGTSPIIGRNDAGEMREFGQEVIIQLTDGRRKTFKVYHGEGGIPV